MAGASRPSLNSHRAWSLRKVILAMVANSASTDNEQPQTIGRLMELVRMWAPVPISLLAMGLRAAYLGLAFKVARTASCQWMLCRNSEFRPPHMHRNLGVRR